MSQANPVAKKTKDDNHLAAEERNPPLNIRPNMLSLDALPEELIPKQQVGLSDVFTLYNAPRLPG